MTKKYKHHIERGSSSWSYTGPKTTRRMAASRAAMALEDNTGCSRERSNAAFRELMDGAKFVEIGDFRASIREA